MTISTEYLFTIDVRIAPPIDVGETPGGFRRVIPITGGTVSGPALNGTVLPGGADWNLTRPDGAVEVWARYEIRTDDGAVVSIVNEGTVNSAETPYEESGVLMLTRPTFEVGEGGPTWLNAGSYVGELVPGAGGVQIRMHRMSPAPH